MIGAGGFVFLFLLVPETFWDRTPVRRPSKRPSFLRRLSSRHGQLKSHPVSSGGAGLDPPLSPAAASRQKDLHVGFAPDMSGGAQTHKTVVDGQNVEGHHSIQSPEASHHHHHKNLQVGFAEAPDSDALANTGPSVQRSTSLDVGHSTRVSHEHHGLHASSAIHNNPAVQNPDNEDETHRNPAINVLSSASPRSHGSATPEARHSINSPYYNSALGSEANVDYFAQGPNLDNEKIPASSLRAQLKVQAYTHNLRQQPPKSFRQHLKIWHGRLNNDKWLKVMVRPFILFVYPSVAWSALVYSCSIGWLIVISECVAVIYRDPHLYNFTALQTGLVYISPFIGGVLGTGVAGKVSDIIVMAMSRRNGGLYEPEFRLVMAIPIIITTCIGLMGFGWSAQERDHWIVPTIFFGIISFGCSLGSTTSITFCVDSYRQYAGEALVTLNFAKNIFHGLVFSLFVSHWLADDGPKTVFIWIGVIQLIALLFTIPMFIYGKRARMWTVRKNLMEKF